MPLELLQAAVEGLHEPLLLVDALGVIRYGNAAATRALGVAEFVGRPLQSLVDDAVAVRLGALIGECSSAQESPSVRLEIPSGQPWTARARRLSVTSDDGMSLLTLEPSVGQQVSLPGSSASSFAHDVGNLLTVMFAQIETLRGEAVDPRGDLAEPVTAAADELQHACERVRALTLRMLKLGRGAASAASAELLQVGPWWHRFSDLLRRLVRDDINFRVHLGARLPGLWIDPSQLEQILLNLVVNAVDAMPDGGRLDVRFATTADELGRTSLSIDVADTGVGMAPDVQRRIFEPYFSTKDESLPVVAGGAGIGLASVRELIDELDGSIRVHSTPGLGTRFVVRLPANSNDWPVPVTPQWSVVGETSRRTYRLLLCEDDPAVRTVLESILRTAGHEVLAESDPERLVERVTQTAESAADLRFDALVTDMIMPGMSGTALARRLRNQLSLLPVLYVTGHAASSELRREVSEGGRETAGSLSEWLQKPFTRGELLDALDSCVARAGSASRSG